MSDVLLPALYLPLDDILPERKFRDASVNKNHGVSGEGVTLSPDDLFGACACFSGDQQSYIQVSSSGALEIPGDITLESWVCVTESPSDFVGIIVKGASNHRNYGLWYHSKRYFVDFQRHVGETLQDCAVPSSLPRKLNTWYHIAAVLQGDAARVYIHDAQRQPLLAEPLKAQWRGLSVTTPDALRIGFAGYHGGHKGRLAHVRVYDRAISLDQIMRDMESDCMSLAPFRKSHPIDFHVYDDDESPVIYISDEPAGKRLHLELHNTSAQPIRLLSIFGAQASKINHHFSLQFRRGVLLEKSPCTIKLQPDFEKDWSLAVQEPAPDDKTFSLYLLYRGELKELKPAELRKLVFEGVTAAPGSGSRGAQIQLIPHQELLAYAGEDKTPISGACTQFVHVSSQAGRKNVPLHIGFIDSNRVLNDGETKNHLKLRITNTSQEALLLSGAKFVISFDAQRHDEKPDKAVPIDWALTKTDKLKNQVKVTLGEIGFDDKDAIGETPKWSYTFGPGVVLEPRKHLQIDIKDLVSPSPNGFANLYLRYVGIPGYWEGQFVCLVEKGPMIYREGRVGIGVVNPEATLHVKGSLKLGAPLSPMVEPQQITLTAGWVPVGANTPRFWKDALGMVHLDGMFYFKNRPFPNIHTEVFKLPAGFLPRDLIRFFARAECLQNDLATSIFFPLLLGQWGHAEVEFRQRLKMENTVSIMVSLEGISYLPAS